MTAIAKQNMVLNLQIGMWSGHRLDKEKSAEVTRDAGAQAGAARVNKHLVPKEALAPIVTAMGLVRSHFYENTLPWKDNGDRLLPRPLYMKFIEEHGRRKDKFNEEVRNFLENVYPAVVDQAAFRMGDLFKSEDYPRSRDLYHRFYVQMDIDAVTEANDFRVVGLDDDEVERIKGEMAAQMSTRINTAMRDVWSRLSTALGHFSDRMNSDGVFKEATVSNLYEIVDLIPALNVTDDPDLARLADEIKAKLGGYDAKTLRAKPEIRAAIGAEAKEIVDNMAGFMRAFGVEA